MLLRRGDPEQQQQETEGGGGGEGGEAGVPHLDHLRPLTASPDNHHLSHQTISLSLTLAPHLSLPLTQVPSLDPMPERRSKSSSSLQSPHGGPALLVVPPPPLPRHGGDGDRGLAGRLDQAAGEGVVAEQETQPEVSGVRGARPLPGAYARPSHGTFARTFARTRLNSLS